MSSAVLIAVKQDVLVLTFESLFYGLYAVLFMESTYLLCTQGLKSGGRKIMFLATIVMFGVATCQWGLQLAVILKSLPFDTNPALVPSKSSVREREDLRTTFNSLSRINYLISDSIVVWRAWILWGRSRKVILLLSTLYALTFVGAIIDLALGINLQYSGKIINDQSWGANIGRGLILPFVIPTLCTNFCATFLIACKAWFHRRQVRAHFVDEGSPREKVEKILSLIVESGLLYCLAWSVYLMGARGLFDGKFGYNVMAAVMSPVSGIYPTIIIVLVCLQRTHCDRQFTYDNDATMQFATRAPTSSTFMTAQPKQEKSLVLPMRVNDANSKSEISSDHTSSHL